ncbi:hypothetical protein JYU19_00205 [bacterium AH-315-J21]|nr:hypothetical protein [bacterium AH-315-J21]
MSLISDIFGIFGAYLTPVGNLPIGEWRYYAVRQYSDKLGRVKSERLICDDFVEGE